MISRNLRIKISANGIKKILEDTVDQLFDDPYPILTAKSNLTTINFLKSKIRNIENAVLSCMSLRPEFEILTSMPGIGNILALTIMLEIDDINRFAKAGNYAFYSRCVKIERLSDEKKGARQPQERK